MLIIKFDWNYGSHYWFDRLELWRIPMVIMKTQQYFRVTNRKDRLLPTGRRCRGDILTA